MKTKAATVLEFNKLTIEEVELAPPRIHEVLVRMQAAGVCHSDLHTLRGELRATPPMVLGHEGAGVVEMVGDGVTHVAPGDHVLINWLPACGTCAMCYRGHPNLCRCFGDSVFQGMLADGTSRLKTRDGRTLKHFLGAATMAQHAVIQQASAIRIADDVLFEVAALIGCAVMTGIGAVVNTAQARAGDSAAVIGCGGVGLSAIQGCRLTGCHPIVAVDVLDDKLEFARKLGATHTLNAKEGDCTKYLHGLTGGIGPDLIVDTVGSAQTIAEALKGVRPAGTAVIAGLHAGIKEVSVAASNLILQGKRLLGSFVGSANPQVDLPKLVELYRAGRLQLEDLVTKRYPLEALPQAFDDMEAGAVARGVIVFDQ